MSSIKVPDGYCATCHKKTLDRIDLSTDAEQTLKSLKKKMMVAFMIGDRDGALAEISYQLGITPGELSVAGPWEAPAMDRDMARAIADEIFHKFPDVLEDLFERRGVYEKMRRRAEEHERYNEKMRRMYDDPYMLGGVRARPSLRMDELSPPARKEYYIPPYRVKKNEPGSY